MAVADRIDAAVRPHGCRARLVGSVARQGWSMKDLDVALDVDGDDTHVLRALDTLRAWMPLAWRNDNQLLFFDGALRPIEVWLEAPPSFWCSADAFRREVRRLERRDHARLKAALKKAIERERPPEDMAHVPQAVFERQCAVMTLLLRDPAFSPAGRVSRQARDL